MSKESPWCPECGLFVPCETCGKPRLLTRLGIAPRDRDESADIAAAVAAEREACAELLEAHVVDLNSGRLMAASHATRDAVRGAYADAIRARGGK